uniref:Uncharacterized protein n=1 Tax=Timema cristinae TaxID=61476 RepID=A0A7R9DE07_TIMCR|nr:unnamed protein product [Timema cristinae]
MYMTSPPRPDDVRCVVVGPSSSGAPNRPLPPTPDEEESSDRTLVLKRREAAANSPHEEKDAHARPDLDEQLLLKDWDFARFFQGFNDRLDKIKLDEAGAKYRDRTGGRGSVGKKAGKELPMALDRPAPYHRRNESDSKISSSPFGGFRRENSDLFPASSRHSAILLEGRNLGGGGIFSGNNRRGSDVAGATVGKKGAPHSKTGEPVLTDFVVRESSGGVIGDGDQHPARPRREKTEGDIVLLRNRQELRDELQTRRLDVEQRFSREAERMRRRSSARPLNDTDDGQVSFQGAPLTHRHSMRANQQVRMEVTASLIEND